MKLLFRLYHQLISPAFHSLSRLLSGNPYSGCKFEPTCSCYCEQAIEKYGVLKGGLKAVVRISKCHPFSESRGFDPV